MDNSNKAIAKRLAELEKIVRKLLSDAPWKQHDKSIPDQGQTHEKQKEVEPGSAVLPQRNPAIPETNNPKEKWYKSFQWWKSRLELVAIVAAVGYAVVTFSMWRDNAKQFETANRPWITLQNVTMSTTVGDGPMQQTIFGSPNEAYTHRQFSYEVQNYGHLPAFGIASSAIILQGDQHRILLTWVSKAVCSDALPAPTSKQAWMYDPRIPTDVVFPNSPIREQAGAVSNEPLKHPEIGYEDRYLVVCMVYKDISTGKTHHTKLLYWGKASEWKATIANGIIYYPIDTLEPSGTDAD